MIYVNDNFVEPRRGRRGGDEGLEGADRADQAEAGHRLVKARHSIFFETPLEYLLRENDIDRVILVGQAAEQCIVYSALDAYIRHFEVAVPRDAVAHIHEHLAEAAFEMIELNMDAEVADADELELTRD